MYGSCGVVYNNRHAVFSLGGCMKFELGDKVKVLDGTCTGTITAKKVGGIPNLFEVTSKTKFPNEYVWESFSALFFTPDMTKED